MFIFIFWNINIVYITSFLFIMTYFCITNITWTIKVYFHFDYAGGGIEPSLNRSYPFKTAGLSDIWLYQRNKLIYLFRPISWIGCLAIQGNVAISAIEYSFAKYSFIDKWSSKFLYIVSAILKYLSSPKSLLPGL